MQPESIWKYTVILMTKEGFFFTYFYISRNVYSCALEYVTQFITCYHGQIRIMSKQLNIDLFVNPSFGFVMVVLATLRHFLRSFHKYVQKKKYWQLSGGFWRKLSDHALVTLNRAELSLKDKKIFTQWNPQQSILDSTIYDVYCVTMETRWETQEWIPKLQIVKLTSSIKEIIICLVYRVKF